MVTIHKIVISVALAVIQLVLVEKYSLGSGKFDFVLVFCMHHFPVCTHFIEVLQNQHSFLRPFLEDHRITRYRSLKHFR